MVSNRSLCTHVGVGAASFKLSVGVCSRPVGLGSALQCSQATIAMLAMPRHTPSATSVECLISFIHEGLLGAPWSMAPMASLARDHLIRPSAARVMGSCVLRPGEKAHGAIVSAADRGHPCSHPPPMHPCCCSCHRIPAHPSPAVDTQACLPVRLQGEGNGGGACQPQLGGAAKDQRLMP